MWIGRNMLLLGLAVLAGCGKKSSQQGKAPEPDPAAEQAACEEIRTLIPAAAGNPYKELAVVFSSALAPSPDDTDNQTLTWWLMFGLKPEQNEDPAVTKAKREDFDIFSNSTPDPTALVRALSKGKDQGLGTVIHSSYITDFTCKIEGESATGVVSFKADNVYQGRVEYTANKTNDKWQIVEFRLPGHKVKFSRGQDGKWKKADLASG